MTDSSIASFAPFGDPRRNVVTLSDGRAFAFAAFGPAGGVQVVFLPGAGMSGSLCLPAAALEAGGLSVRAIDRPGLGQSATDPEKSLVSVADDVAALYGGERPVAVGYSQGAPFALALAAAGVARAALLVAPQDELAREDVRAALPPEIAGFAGAMNETPDETEAFLAGAADADGLAAIIARTAAPADRALYEAEPFATMLRTALREGFAGGGAGYARDTRAAMTRWPFDLGAMAVPVTVMAGRGDTSPVHAAEGGAGLAARIAGARHVVIEDGGGALPWTHAGDIVAEIRALVR
ncbi:alpha/beta hydrolase [Acuticoccus sp. MNP-M23]|uniref:alpha/beta fold hydrolase n=1 Tax=Acuticoccus sp. MNP-M23 TaxID=3072793 RepID=UPI0028168D2E|nr:alpha/beta hydrolase [Acuticoccus sp. MNP-M23]WMS43334.1 alpha/beta hydrolase [Acuticoccus sp. MNP-M23]